MDYIFSIIPYLMQGAVFSIKLYVITILFAIPIGIICAIGKLTKFKPLVWLLEAYTWVFRGTPLLLQLLFVYYGLPFTPLGLELSSEMAAYIAFVLNYGAYFTEIFRAGILAIDKGQYEAAKTLGMSYPMTMWSIIIPQAVKVIIPPLGNEGVTLIKDTALCSVISIQDIMRNAKSVVSRDFNVAGYIIAAIMYLLMTFVIIQIFKYIEKKFSYYD